MKNLAYWKLQRDISLQDKFLRSRKFIEQFSHVDQMWEILEKNYGHVLAVRDLRGKTKIKFSYLELAGNIEKASKDLGWEPVWDYKKALKKTYDWYFEYFKK